MTRMVNKLGFFSLEKRGLKGHWAVAYKCVKKELFITAAEGKVTLLDSIGKTNPIIGAVSQVNSYQC